MFDFIPPTKEEREERKRRNEEMRQKCPVGTVLWHMTGRRTKDADGHEKTIWAAKPECIEHANERGFLTTKHITEPTHGSSWGLIHDTPQWGGYYLTREMALESRAGRPMIEDYIPPEDTEPQEMTLGEIMPDDAVITIWDGVDTAHIYEGIPFMPVHGNAYDCFPETECAYRGTVREATLKEIRAVFPKGIITVFAESQLNGAAYQIGAAYEPQGEKWRYYAKTGGYA
jgi:hypothetical protein